MSTESQNGNLLTLDRSFGFNSLRLHNLSVLPGPVLAYITGRYLHCYHVKTRQVCLRQSSNGQAFGQVTTHPTLSHLATGENGLGAGVKIYEWPSFHLVADLRLPNAKGYSCLRYNEDGSLLATVTSAPDAILTLWDWCTGQVVLQTQAHAHQVYAACFSNSDPTQLATCGVGHLKIWEMSKTLTGLKLVEKMQHFGKTETCDLLDALPLPDGSCATGSPWGNVLIWADGSLKLQVVRTGRLPCHSAPITQLKLFSNSLLTAGMDGAVRVWNYEAIEFANTAEDDPGAYVETEPLYELLLADAQGSVTASILSLVKASVNPDDSLWFVQDTKGGVWSVHISTSVSERVEAPERVFWSHAGPVVAIQTSPAQPLFATLAEDCKLIVFDYQKGTIEAWKEFNSPGTCLFWLPTSIAPSGNLMIAGFADGMLRLLMTSTPDVDVVQVVKPHAKSVVAVAVDCDKVATASEDGTVFFFRCHPLRSGTSQLILTPLGFCNTNGPAFCLSWINQSTLLVGCEFGKILMFEIPSEMKPADEENSFLIELNSELLEMDELSTASLTLTTVPFLWPTQSQTFWFSCSHLLVEFSLKERQIVQVLHEVLPDNTSVCSVHHFAQRNCLLFGMCDGRLVAVELDPDGRLTKEWWWCGVHEDAVRGVAVSWDGSVLVSCGEDGGIFTFQLPIHPVSPLLPQPPLVHLSKYEVGGIVDEAAALTLEQSKVKAREDHEISCANKAKQIVLDTIIKLKEEYKNITMDNSKLPAEVKFSKNEFLVDPRILAKLHESLDEKKQLVYLKLARDAEKSEKLLEKLTKYFLEDIETLTTRVSAIRLNRFVETFRLTRLCEQFYDSLKNADQLLTQADEQGSSQTTADVIEVAPETPANVPDSIESLVKQVATIGDVSRNRKLMSVCRQHAIRRKAEAERRTLWQHHMARKPNPLLADPRDALAIENAQSSLGDYKLKTSQDHNISDGHKLSTVYVSKVLLTLYEQVHRIKSDFNQKVFQMQSRKQTIIQNKNKSRQQVNRIINEIPEELRWEPFSPPSTSDNLEFSQHLNSREQSSLDSDNICSSNDDDSICCDIEINQFKLKEKLQLQQTIISQMEKDIKSFDDDLQKLIEGKINLEVDVKLLELFILKLNREILILRNFESDENEMKRVVFKLLKDKQAAQLKLNQLSEYINEKLKDIQILKDDEKKLMVDFLEMVADNKYYEFLKKIYKKKYRAPKMKSDDDNDDDDDSLSSDTDSDSETDDNVSMDSKEIALTRLSESTCPDDCDRALYDKSLEERRKRHDLGLKISQVQMEIEMLAKSYDSLTKEIDRIGCQCDVAQKSVDDLQREKLRHLNEISTVVVLKLSQIQNFKNETNVEHMDSSLVMNTILLSDLYNRITDLNRETAQEKERYDRSKEHLKRMGVDIKYMEDLVLKLKLEIEETMLRKFGTMVDLDELEEAVVKKLVAEMDNIVFGLETELSQQLLTLKEAAREAAEKYAQCLVDNTKRCNILSILKDKKLNLEEILTNQETKKPCQAQIYDDVDQLQKIVCKQESQVKELEKQIQSYKMKSRPLSAKEVEVDTESFLTRKVRMLVMGMPDGSQLPVSASLAQRLLLIADDVENLTVQIGSGLTTPNDSTFKRLKKLVEEFMDAIPEEALEMMWTKLIGSPDGGEEVGRESQIDALLDDPQVLTKSADMIALMAHPISTAARY